MICIKVKPMLKRSISLLGKLLFSRRIHLPPSHETKGCMMCQAEVAHINMLVFKVKASGSWQIEDECVAFQCRRIRPKNWGRRRWISWKVSQSFTSSCWYQTHLCAWRKSKVWPLPPHTAYRRPLFISWRLPTIKPPTTWWILFLPFEGNGISRQFIVVGRGVLQHVLCWKDINTVQDMYLRKDSSSRPDYGCLFRRN